MVLEQLWTAIPRLDAVINDHALVNNVETVWVMLRQLMQANAPSTATMLPGGIYEQVSDIAAGLGLADRLESALIAPGFSGLWLGVAKPDVDLVVVTHLDRTTFRVRQLIDQNYASIVPLQSGLNPDPFTQTPARALRYDPADGRIVTTAKGVIALDDSGFMFIRESGDLSPLDVITFDLTPRRQGLWVRGSGLDSAAAVLSVLGAASVLRQVEEVLLEQNKRCLIVFSDRQGTVLPAVNARLGAIEVKCQPVTDGKPVQYESGIAFSYLQHGAANQIVPLNYQQLTHDLANEFAHIATGVAQYNKQLLAAGASISRDERTLGLMGPPLSCPHAGQETIHMADLQASVRWLASFIPLVLNLVPAVTAQYALGR